MMKFPFIFFLLIHVNLFAQDTIRVPDHLGTIQEALDIADSTTVILISAGEYFENLVWPNDIDGIKLIGSSGSKNTIINGDYIDRVLFMEGIENPSSINQSISKNTFIKGITLTNGYTSQYGAGAFIRHASPTLDDVKFTDNVCENDSTFAKCYGAGAFIENFRGVISNCVFSNNKVIAHNAQGVGLHLVISDTTTIQYCQFETNVSESSNVDGVGFSLDTYDKRSNKDLLINITECEFSGNWSTTGDGAGLYADFHNNLSFSQRYFVDLNIESCDFLGNYFTEQPEATKGGGVFINFYFLNLDTRNCNFRNNVAKSGGIFYLNSSLANSTLINDNLPMPIVNFEACRFYGSDNLQGTNGFDNGIYNINDPIELNFLNCEFVNFINAEAIYYFQLAAVPQLNLTHCTFFNVQANFIVGKLNAYNSIFWGTKLDTEAWRGVNEYNFEHCILGKDYDVEGEGNLETDPLFLRDSISLFRKDSPVYNGAKILDIDSDINGLARPMPSYSIPDIGAYEIEQMIPNILVKFYYDQNQNGIKDETERYVSDGAIVDQNNKKYINFRKEGIYEVVPFGQLQISYDPDDQNWLTTNPEVYNYEVMSDSFHVELEYGIFPKKLFTDITMSISGENFRCDSRVSHNLTIKNTGNSIEEGIVWLSFDPKVEGTNTFGSFPDHVIPDSLVGWDIDLYPSEVLHVEFHVPSPPITNNAQVGQLFEFCSFTENTSEYFDYCYQTEHRCSYDPNDKLVYPIRPDSLVLIEDPLIYTIRFQNTGNDYAEDVVITDVINEDLDLGTLEILSTSHPTILQVESEGNELIFKFEGIYLIDSLTNPKASQGYVTFMISPFDDIEINTLVDNTANIFFDSNPPIITNTTNSIFVDAFPTSNTENLENLELIKVSPNPASEFINFSEIIDDLNLYDLEGREILQKSNISRLSIDDLTKGVYILILEKNNTKEVKRISIL